MIKKPFGKNHIRENEKNSSKNTICKIDKRKDFPKFSRERLEKKIVKKQFLTFSIFTKNLWNSKKDLFSFTDF